MARITPHYAAQPAFNYYLADYYSADSPKQFRGQWLGAGADRLGLAGEVGPAEFMRLLKNQHPRNASKLSPRNYDNRRCGWDVNFNCAKSVSVAFAATADLAIVDAVRQSAEETLLDMEQDVMTRVNTARGKQHHRKTANLVAGVWIHPEARGVAGHLPDPQIHVHAFISNHTHAGDRWTAADISNIFRDAQGYYEALFQSRLAAKLQELGYPVERNGRDFEIAGISRSLIARFSKRSAEIRDLIDNYNVAAKLAAKRGISLADAKGMVGAISRKSKNASYSLGELQAGWRAQMTPEERRDLAELKQSSPADKRRIIAKEAVDFALEHRFEHQAVVRERDILRDAILFGIGAATPGDIKAELASRELIRQGKDEAAVLTTRAIQQEEQLILDFATSGRGAVKPLNTDYQIEREWLSGEQQQAVTGLLESTDRMQILRGVAGVGKSTLLQQVLPAITATGKPVAVVAPTNKAVASLNKDGFQAATIHSFLLASKRQQVINNGVIIVDESGLVGNPTFASLVQLAKDQNARIIAVGDSAQHLPIERGHPLKLLETHAGITPKEVTQIRRQQGNYKQAVTHLSRGEIEVGLKEFQDLGFVHEIPDDLERNAALAKAYADARESDKKQKLLVIAPTHAERHQITDAIRSELKARQLISADEREITTLLAKQLTVAQRRDSLSFAEGDVVVFHAKGAGGISPGDRLTVARVTRDKVFAPGDREVPLESAGGFSVFRPETARYAIGDTIRLTRGRRPQDGRKKLVNGSLHTIKSIHKGVLTLNNGEKLGRVFSFFDHGVAVTSYVSQGTTVDQAFLAASSLSFPASDAAQMYVSASRARKRVDIFTDSTEGLLQAARRFRTKPFATDVVLDPLTGPAPTRLAQRLNRLRTIAHRFATRQLQRFHAWLSGRQAEPQLAR